MSTLFTFLLIVIMLWFYLTKRKKACMVFCVLTLINFIIFGSGIFSALTLNYLELTGKTPPLPSWKSNNAIVLLGAGSVSTPANVIRPTVLAYSRINEAAKLYFSCINSKHSCSIILSGGDLSKTGTSEAAVYQNELIALGVKNSNIILENNSRNTYENAKLTSKILQSNHFDNIVLVTSGIHLRRSLLYFSHFGISAIPIAADYMGPFITAIPIGYNFAVSDFIFHEYIGILRLYVYNYLGWNKNT